MFSEYNKNEAIVRLKGDMKSLNTTMRDPTLFRIIDDPHPLVGNTYRVWPTYDFVAPIEDSLDGVTHAFRTKEYELRHEVYFHILGILGLRKPELMVFSRLEIRGSAISKRILKPLVSEGLVDGWNDPRLPTLDALRRRGFLPKAIREFVLSLGISTSESEADWSILESINRKMLDPITPRYFFVPNPIMLEIQESPHVKVKLKNHPDKELGERDVITEGLFYVPRQDIESLNKDNIIRLLGLYNVKILSLSPTKIVGQYYGKDLKEDVKKVQWVSDGYIEFSVMITDQLLLNNEFNKNSLKIIKGYAERACSKLKPNDMIQFMRFGFCRIDSSGVGIRTHK
jgi:glutamyl-tRNA synthetase